MFSTLVAGLSIFSTVVAPAKPRLVVVISIDQFRADYLTRFAEHYLPANPGGNVGGFRFLMENGANFVNSRYSHVPTETGPGHAIIGTGSCPSLTGIVSNGWYARATRSSVYCVSDPASKDIFSAKASMSPKNLKVTTFGDELKLATAGKSKNVSIALKDRAAILMIGHQADGVVWFDRGTGRWTTSDYYAPSGKLPAWAANVNNDPKRNPDKDKGRTWELTLPVGAKELSFPSSASSSIPGFGQTFPHKLADDKNFYGNWTLTPWANTFVFDTALEAVKMEALGSDSIPDVLTINLSSNDYLGHAFGPFSPEAAQMCIDTDKALSTFLNGLRTTVPGGLENVMVVVTADHGVLGVPEDLIARNMPASRLATERYSAPVEAALENKFGAKGLIDPLSWGESQVYLDYDACAKAKVKPDDAAQTIQEVLLSVPQCYAAYTRKQLLGLAPSVGLVLPLLVKNFDKDRSGDVIFVFQPGILTGDGKTGTSHGSPWPYDTSVPLLLFGSAIEPGVHTELTGPEDIAPTICTLVGAGLPSGCVGKVVGLKR